MHTAPPPPSDRAGFRTSSYEVVKRLSSAGIQAVNCYGSPMTWDYAPEDQGRIDAVLG